MQAVGRYGYLDGSWSVFDYGCGKGGDVRILCQNGLKVFFGTYQNAQLEARQLLFSAGNRELVRQACREAAAHGIGWLDEDRSLQLHTRLVERLPAVLRVYVGCASFLYGDVTSADLIKIHGDSAKLTLMSFDNFEGKALPRMVERIKIRLHDQDIERFAYGKEHVPPYLYRKSRFITEEFPHYLEQVAFEHTLEELHLFDFRGYGPPPQVFEDRLRAARLAVEDFELKPTRTLPNLNEKCGRHLTFRDLIQCGETQAKTSIPNIPEHPETYNALARLAALVLDPLIAYFGPIALTYGFCSRELAKHIPGRIAPELDQHAGHELNTRGKPICKRLGAAADFIILDESMLEVAQWIVNNTPFDRLYFYGNARPLHVSYGSEGKREVVLMKASGKGLLIPKVVGIEAFLTLSGAGVEEKQNT